MRHLLLALLLPLAAHAEALDEADAAFRDQAFARAWASPPGERVEWQNPVTGNGGRIEVWRDSVAAGHPCRELMENLTIDGRASRGVTVGCNTGGGWQVVRSAPLGPETGAAAPDSVPVELPPYQPPADISADPPQRQPPVTIIVRPRVSRQAVPPTAEPGTQ